jgi:hypothetical protein
LVHLLGHTQSPVSIRLGTLVRSSSALRLSVQAAAESLTFVSSQEAFGISDACFPFDDGVGWMLNWDRRCRNAWALLSGRMINSGMEYQRSVACFGVCARQSWLYTVLGWVVSIGQSSCGYIQTAFWQPNSPHRYSRALVLLFHCHTMTLAGDMAFGICNSPLLSVMDRNKRSEQDVFGLGRYDSSCGASFCIQV